ncbi:MAG: AtpZ/AtpI family protein [Epsilonproteobacteria bacterium]|nr:AtpZ/AtpI family protein [Campylobacterota bacterium]
MQEQNQQEPKYQKVVAAADVLSLGISIVVAILIGVALGYWMEKLFNNHWLFWLGVFWGIGAAILNIYKAYKKQQKELDELAKDPKYAKRRYDSSDEDDW